MTSPTPPVSLSGSFCSVISDNTLYTYSPAAFQALALQKNATWSQLENGFAVNNAVCVLQPASGAGSSDVLWIVGGVSTNGNSSYPGLQSYTFSSQTWQTVTPDGQQFTNLVNHAALYLPGPNQILVYAGSADPATPSVNTFTIGASPPYLVTSCTSNNPPAISPLLLQWDDYSAITVGGAADNANVYIFSGTSWNPTPVQPALPGPLKSSSSELATLVQGSDGSRVLELYDMSVTPNNITQIVLEDGSGQVTQVGQTIPTISRRSEPTKRDLTLANWPPYNSSLAPTTIRQGFSLATSSEGLIAIVGGASDTQSLALFNDQTNTWYNTSQFFGDSASQQPIIASSTSVSSSATSFSSSSATSSPISSPTASSQPVIGDHPKTSLILGAVLGSVLGFIALLIILLLILRCRRRNQAQKRMHMGPDDDDDEKDRMSFEDRGDPFMKEVAGPTYPASHASMSVYEGETGHRQANSRTHRRSETRGSEKSTTYLVPKKDNAYEMSTIRDRSVKVPSPVNETSRTGSSLQVPTAGHHGPSRTPGWSRYFSGIESNGRNSASTTHGNAGSAVSMRSSTSSNHDCASHGPTQLPPLDMGQGFHEVRINRVVTGNGGERQPTFTRDSEERPRTVSSTFSTVPPSTAPSIWSQNEEQSTWTPVTKNDPWTAAAKPRDTTRDTTASSYYGGSVDESEYDRNSRISGAGGLLGRVTSGAHVLPSTVQEEDENDLDRNKPFRKSASVKKPQQALISDLSWFNLGKK